MTGVSGGVLGARIRGYNKIFVYTFVYWVNYVLLYGQINSNTMDKEQLGQEMFTYLTQTDDYNGFMDFMENRGFDRVNLERDLEQFERNL